MAKTPAKQAKAKAPPGPSADGWLQDIDAALKREDKWREKGKKVVQRYRDERERNVANRSKVNILWSNTEVQKAALYARTAKPDVRRRFADAASGRATSRAAAEVLERSLTYCTDAYDVDSAIEGAIEDLLLPGRGTCWVSYDPEITGDDDNATITDQKLCLDYVYWEDYCHGLSRIEKNIPWHARRHPMRQGEFDAKFPNAVKGAGASFQLTTASDSRDTEGDKFVEVWEVWNKPKRERLYVARGYTEILQTDPDPLGLEGFFPCPAPLYSVKTTDRLIPEPEFCQYQDQADELDAVSTRYNRLLSYMKWTGIYDAAVEDAESPLKNMISGDDGEFQPHTKFAMIRDKGGIESAFGFNPIERISGVLAQLGLRANELVQFIYQITGISDIMRGSTDPNETKGAQQLKAQFGSMRMQRKQRDVQRFIRDLYRIMAEIVAEHFTQETLAAITGMDLPTKAEQDQVRQKVAAMEAAQAQQPPMPPPQMGAAPPPGAQPPAMPAGLPQVGAGGVIPAGAAPMVKGAQGAPSVPPEVQKILTSPTWEDVMTILRSDKLRSYRVDIETDSTVLEDADAQKARRIEAMQAINDLLEKAYLAATQAPMMLPLIKETFLFGLRSFNIARSLEQAAEDAFDELMQNPPAPPASKADKPDQSAFEQAKLALEEKKALADAKHKADSLEAENIDRAARLKIEQDKATTDASAKDQELALKRDALALDARKHDQAQVAAGKDHALRVAAHNKQLVDEATASATADAGGTSAGPAGGETVIGAMLKGIETLAAEIANGQRQIATGQMEQSAALTALASQIGAPRRIVRGQDGRAVGVEVAAQ